MSKIYLDYSATTMPDKEVIKAFNNGIYANANSNHDLGREANKLIQQSIKNICDYFHIKNNELIFTSGASESNNTILKGIKTNKKTIITTELEHSSIYGPLSYLENIGYKVKFVKLKNGLVDIEDLEKQIDSDTFLVSIGAVNFETGIRQDIEKIGKILRKYDLYFHSDITQCLGKDKIDLTNVDLASFSGHKLYCFKGIGGLIKKENIPMEPLIHGGKSTSIYRAGTPQNELIFALSKSFDLFKNSLDEKYQYVSNLNQKIRKHLKKYSNIKINSIHAIPHILNISLLGINSNETQEYFNKKEIYLSTKTACSKDKDYSLTIYKLTNDIDRASSSIRISLSYKTTEKEVDIFLKELDNLMEKYNENL